MATQSRNLRFSSAALAAAGLLFLLYPLLRPYADESTLDGAQAMASSAWIFSHVFAIGGFILLVPGVLGLYGTISGQRPGYGAVVSTGLGVGLLLPYYGAETFGLQRRIHPGRGGDLAIRAGAALERHPVRRRLRLVPAAVLRRPLGADRARAAGRRRLCSYGGRPVAARCRQHGPRCATLET